MQNPTKRLISVKNEVVKESTSPGRKSMVLGISPQRFSTLL
jgi:hypothetical protein